jgi:hypothetical protein
MIICSPGVYEALSKEITSFATAPPIVTAWVVVSLATPVVSAGSAIEIVRVTALPDAAPLAVTVVSGYPPRVLSYAPTDAEAICAASDDVTVNVCEPESATPAASVTEITATLL